MGSDRTLKNPRALLEREIQYAIFPWENSSFPFTYWSPLTVKAIHSNLSDDGSPNACACTHTRFSFGKHWDLRRWMGWVTGRSRGRSMSNLIKCWPCSCSDWRLPAPGDKVPSRVTHQKDFAESTGSVFLKPHFHSYSSSNKRVSHSVMSDSLRPQGL